VGRYVSAKHIVAMIKGYCHPRENGVQKQLPCPLPPLDSSFAGMTKRRQAAKSSWNI